MFCKQTYRKIIYGVIILFIIGCSQQQQIKLPSLNESFQKKDKKPFGGYVAYHHFKSEYNAQYIETIGKPFDMAWNDIRDYTDVSPSLYVVITKNLAINHHEANAMLSYLNDGNDLLISADYIDKELLDKIGCETNRDSEIIGEVAGKMNETRLTIHPAETTVDSDFKYYYYPFLNYFTGFDPDKTKILGYNETGQPDFILIYVGKGRLYLHAAPRAFSNYFLLSDDNYKYLDNLLAYLRADPKNIFWDEYYKNKTFSRNSINDNQSNQNTFSSFNVINSNPPLLWAFWLSVITILLFILFNIKRKQRIIPEIKPNINTTVVFTETVGRLYFEKKNNKNIAEKMITYFYEHIRNRYFVDTSAINKDFIHSLSRKSGVEEAQVKQLFSTIKNLHHSEEMTDPELLALNNLVQNFYKNKI